MPVVLPSPNPVTVFEVKPDSKYIMILGGHVSQQDINSLHKALQEWVASQDTFFFLNDEHVVGVHRVNGDEEHTSRPLPPKPTILP